MAICAVLCGCDDWVDVADWCEEEAGWLKTLLVLAKGTLSHDTFGEVFRVLDANVFENCFRQWISGIVGVVKGVGFLDGKTVRGSKDGPNTALHMVSAYAVVENSPTAALNTELNCLDSSRDYKPKLAL